MEFKTTAIDVAFKATGRDHNNLPDVSNLPENDHYIVDDYILNVVIEAVNQESNGGKPWEPNYSDGSKKWELFLWIDADDKHPAGFGFSASLTRYDITGTSCGSRHCFHSREAAIHTFKTFPDLYKRVWIRQKK